MVASPSDFLRPLASLAKVGERAASEAGASFGLGGAAKFGLEIKVPDLAFRRDELQAVAIVGKAIEDTLRHNLSHGLQPDGSPMPAVSAATVQRREYRRKQIARGGSQLERNRRQLGEFVAGLGEGERSGRLKPG